MNEDFYSVNMKRAYDTCKGDCTSFFLQSISGLIWIWHQHLCTWKLVTCPGVNIWSGSNWSDYGIANTTSLIWTDKAEKRNIIDAIKQNTSRLQSELLPKKLSYQVSVKKFDLAAAPPTIHPNCIIFPSWMHLNNTSEPIWHPAFLSPHFWFWSSRTATRNIFTLLVATMWVFTVRQEEIAQCNIAPTTISHIPLLLPSETPCLSQQPL